MYSHYLPHNNGTKEVAINNPVFADEVLPLLAEHAENELAKKTIWWSFLTIH